METHTGINLYHTENNTKTIPCGYQHGQTADMLYGQTADMLLYSYFPLTYV